MGYVCIYIYTWNPNVPCFDWSLGLLLEGWSPKTGDKQVPPYAPPSREVVKFPAEFPELKQPTGGVRRFHHRSHVAFIRFREEKMGIFLQVGSLYGIFIYNLPYIFSKCRLIYRSSHGCYRFAGWFRKWPFKETFQWIVVSKCPVEHGLFRKDLEDEQIFRWFVLFSQYRLGISQCRRVCMQIFFQGTLDPTKCGSIVKCEWHCGIAAYFQWFIHM